METGHIFNLVTKRKGIQTLVMEFKALRDIANDMEIDDSDKLPT